MTITPEETPRLRNAAERKVYDTLLAQLQPNDRVIPGQRVTDHLKDHEVDFVVGIEGAGIVCLEVKGGDVWHDGETWWQKRGGHEHRINPVRQAREACYALRDFIEKDDRWTQGRLRWDHVVVFPNADVAADFALPDCPRWKVADRNDLGTLVAHAPVSDNCIPQAQKLPSRRVLRERSLPECTFVTGCSTYQVPVRLLVFA